MTKRKWIVALLVGVLLLAGVVGTFAWLSVTGVLVNEFGFGSVAPSVDETLKDNVKRDVSVKTRARLRHTCVSRWISTGRIRMVRACGMSRLPAPTTPLSGAIKAMPPPLTALRLGSCARRVLLLDVFC